MKNKERIEILEVAIETLKFQVTNLQARVTELEHCSTKTPPTFPGPIVTPLYPIYPNIVSCKYENNLQV